MRSQIYVLQRADQERLSIRILTVTHLESLSPEFVKCCIPTEPPSCCRTSGIQSKQTKLYELTVELQTGRIASWTYSFAQVSGTCTSLVYACTRLHTPKDLRHG